MHNRSLCLSDGFGTLPHSPLHHLSPLCYLFPPWFSLLGSVALAGGGGQSPSPALLTWRGLPLVVEFGVCDTEFAQLDWLHLELMGRYVGLGLPLGQ